MGEDRQGGLLQLQQGAPSVLPSPESGVLGISCPRQTLLHPTLC